MLTEYVFLTQPVLDVSLLPVMVQIVTQSTAPAMVLYASIRRRSVLERFMLLLFPMVFFVTYAFMDILLGGSFLGGGFGKYEALVQYLLRSHVSLEICAVLALFPPAFLLVRRWYHGSLLSILGDISIWLQWGLCAWITVPLLRGRFPSIGPFGPEDLVVSYVYGVYTLLAQLLLNLTAILLHLLFSEHAPKGDLEELPYDPDWCRRELYRIMFSFHKVFLYAMVPLLVLICALAIPALQEEGLGGAGGAPMLFLLGITGWCTVVLFRLLVPRSVPGWRRLIERADSERLQQLFCREYFDERHPPLRGTRFTATPHFLLDAGSLAPALYYLPDYTGTERTRRGLALCFQDGGVLRTAQLSKPDAQLIQAALFPAVPHQNP